MSTIWPSLSDGYLLYMREAQQYGEESLTSIAKAIDRFETYTRSRPFKAFHQEQAIGFKRHLKEQRNVWTGAPLMEAIEAAFSPRAGQLPKDYGPSRGTFSKK